MSYVRSLLGDYEPRGKLVQGVGKFIAFGLDDPFHVTTVTGLAVYGVGKMMERRTNYGLRMAKRDVHATVHELNKLVNDIRSLRL
jgi:hypothetical protein